MLNSFIFYIILYLNSSMQKELQNTLSQVTMYSKMGRYISNKILKYNKSNSSQRNYHRNSPPKQDYLRIQKVQQTKSERPSLHKKPKSFCMTQPPVGYYKVNHTQVDRNARTYNFNRSVPHFYREKFHCNETKPVAKDLPDISSSKPCVKGLIELKRITGRQQIKGSVRHTIQDPHQQRFHAFKDFRAQKQNHSPVNIDKSLPRNNILFQSAEFAPEYDIVKDQNQHRLDTHVIPFQKVIPRDQEHMLLKKGISDYFDRAESKPSFKATDWKKALPRQKGGILPSYMEKNINTRTSIGLLNLKTLQMNCTNIKKKIPKGFKPQRKPILYVQENGKSKKMVSAALF